MSDTLTLCRCIDPTDYSTVHYRLDGFVSACGRTVVPSLACPQRSFSRSELLSYEPQEGDCAECIRAIQARLRETTDTDAPKESETGE